MPEKRRKFSPQFKAEAGGVRLTDTPPNVPRVCIVTGGAAPRLSWPAAPPASFAFSCATKMPCASILG
jgi:hypothetical protein